MKRKTGYRLSLWVLLLLLGIVTRPEPVRAEETVLSSFEELRKACTDMSGDSAASILCTAEDLVFSVDFEIPSGLAVTFRHFTVPEGITLSVAEQAEVRAYGLTVQGTLINHGRLLQQDLSAAWAGDDVPVFALIPGHVDNRGEMVLTDVYGKRNISRFGGKLTIYETPSYEETRRIVFGDEPEPTAEAVSTPQPVPVLPEKSTAEKIFEPLESILPVLSFLLVLVCLFMVIKTGIASARKENRGKQGTVTTYTAGEDLPFRSDTAQRTGEDHFQRDQRKRIEQLDLWLQNGLIDRKEYMVLKRRYKGER